MHVLSVLLCPLPKIHILFPCSMQLNTNMVHTIHMHIASSSSSTELDKLIASFPPSPHPHISEKLLAVEWNGMEWKSWFVCYLLSSWCIFQLKIWIPLPALSVSSITIHTSFSPWPSFPSRYLKKLGVRSILIQTTNKASNLTLMSCLALMSF